MEEDSVIDAEGETVFATGGELHTLEGHPVEVADPGMPQLDFSTYPNQIFWLIITLLVIYFVLSRIALPRIGSVLAERAGTITKDLASAEELKAKAKEAEASYEKALADARAEAGRIAEETRAEIQAELDAQLAKADAEIAARTAESRKELEVIRAEADAAAAEVARETAREIVATFGAGADPGKVDAAVDARTKG
ncbi:F0F1 ATP synthase subunit B' [Pseudoroseicyclus sp. CLL3-39]|uniref:ATP synthase subunit b n=2 Tax=Pseudoroseicyclus tamaricis TaxID=2705421 RepID=A0A6B2JNV8_9RHOB|nr:F0F1 ATP synthase subunit B' [Pseudoroseicyclus tamaricis]